MNPIFEEDLSLFKKLFKLSYPLVFAMLFQASYTVIDTIYVGKGIGLDAIGGLSIAMPLILIFNAIVLSIAVGSVVLISKWIGANDKQNVKKIVNTVIVYSFIIGIVASLIFIFLAPQITSLFTNNIKLQNYASTFLRTIGFFLVFSVIKTSWSRLFIAEGRAKISSIPSLVSVIVNIILGYYFIFITKSGIAGIALATGISEVCASCVSLSMMFKYRKNTIIKIDRSVKLFTPAMILQIHKSGITPFIRNMSDSMFTIVIILLLRFHHQGQYIAIAGIVARLVQLTNMPSKGATQGGTPYLSFKYGQKKYDEMYSIFKQIVFNVMMVIVSMSIIILVLNDNLVKLFSNNIWAVHQALIFFAIQLVGQIATAVVLNSAFYLQLRGRYVLSAFVSFFPTLIITLPIIGILELFNTNVYIIYLGQSIGMIISALTAFTIFRKDIKNLVSKNQM